MPLPVLMTTKLGRSRDSAPRPYVTHEPMLGRPGCEKPVFMKICAGAWLNCVVRQDFTMAMSSTTVARCGSTSESSAPHCPCFANLKRGPNTAASGRMKAYRWPPMTEGGSGLPSYFVSIGL
jgi:hypothetical protein